MQNQIRIDQIYTEIEKLKRARLDTDVSFTLEAIDEEIESYEQELVRLIDEDIEYEKEYLEKQQQDMDTIKDLEDAQR
jgi:hypothetical protein